jgi:carotenoid cleavage dioxygenase-like enzyme
MESNPARLIVIRKDETGDPLIFDQPPGMVYHHGNLTESDTSLRFHSLMSPDGSGLALFDSSSKAQWPEFQRNHLVEFTLDLGAKCLSAR